MSEQVDRQIIIEAIREVLLEEAQASCNAGECAGDVSKVESNQERPSCVPTPHPVHRVEKPLIETQLKPLTKLTPSRIAIGRTGTRLLTDMYLRIREGHADAKDAVHTEVPQGWPAEHKMVSLKTRCTDRHEYLLFPNFGRRLDDASRSRLESEGTRGADVQLIVGDGLSPLAVLENGLETFQEVTNALKKENFSVGKPMFVQFARIGVADEIGVALGAKATVILVGERPGLGTGDSLSVYIAYGPQMDQDNAQKNCISNVRPIGIVPQEAGEQTAQILKRAFEIGKGGVALGMGYGRQ